MRTERGFDRIVNFSDATVAIALTLLVLPLVDLGRESRPETSVWGLLADHSDTVLAFLLSFAVVWRLWAAHHRALEYFRSYDQVILVLHVLWLLTIVLLPFTTELLAVKYTGGAVPLYVGNLFLSSVTLSLISHHGRRRPELLHQDRSDVTEWVRRPAPWTTPVLLALIVVLTAVFPLLGAWPLLLLLVEGPVDHLRSRRHQ